MKLSKILENEPQEHGEMNLFQDSLRIVFGLDPETIETLIAQVRRHGDTMQIRDQQVRRRAGGRAVELLKQAHEASKHEGDEQYEEDPEMDDEPADIPGISGDTSALSIRKEEV
jgi:hypothetical protein